MLISYDVKHFQEVLINIRKVEYLEQKIKNLKYENNKLKLDRNKLENNFTGFYQDLFIIIFTLTCQFLMLSNIFKIYLIIK